MKTEPATLRDIPGGLVLLVATAIAGAGALAECAGRQFNRAAIWVALKAAGL